MQATYSISLDSPPLPSRTIAKHIVNQPSQPSSRQAISRDFGNKNNGDPIHLSYSSAAAASNGNYSSSQVQQRPQVIEKSSSASSAIGFSPSFQLITKNNETSMISSSTISSATTSRTRKRISGTFANPTLSSLTPKTATNNASFTPSRLSKKFSTTNSDKNCNNKTMPINFDQYQLKQQTIQQVSKTEMKRALKVAIRVRPSSSELGLDALAQQNNNIDNQKESISVQASMNRIGTSQQDFFFDKVFQGTDNTYSIFTSLVQPLIDDILSGKSDKGTVLVYGQTGSGKTYTMGILSPVSDPQSVASNSNTNSDSNSSDKNSKYGSTGIIPLSLRQIFESPLREGKVKISFCQLYIDCAYDLLDPYQQSRSNENDFSRSNNMPAFITSTNNNINSQYKMGTSLMIREDPGRGFFVEGLTESDVYTYEGAIKLINFGLSNRAMASTWMNNTSSRSHTLLTLQFQNGRKMTFVDLAGSERLPMDDIDPQRLEEAKSINASLSALGNVVYALSDAKTKHIPYRDSKLTRLLQDSLSRGSETLLIATISPDQVDYRETLSSLLFAERCMKIEFVLEQQQKFIALVNEERNQREIMMLNEQLRIRQNQQLEYSKSFVPNNGSDSIDDATSNVANFKQYSSTELDQIEEQKKKIKGLENKLKRACEILDEILIANGVKDIHAPTIENSDNGYFYEEIEEVKRTILKKISNACDEQKKITQVTASPQIIVESPKHQKESKHSISISKDLSNHSKNPENSYHRLSSNDSLASLSQDLQVHQPTSTNVSNLPKLNYPNENETPPESSRPSPTPSPIARTMIIDSYGSNIRPLSQLDEFLQHSHSTKQ